MTCVVGVLTQGKAIIAADSIGVAGGDKTVRVDPKIFKLNSSYKENIIIGYTTSFRMGQLLMYSDDILISEKDNKYEFDHKFLVQYFIPRLMKFYADNGYDKSYKDNERKGGCFIIACKNKLFTIEDDFQVGITNKAYVSIGSGDIPAISALYSLFHQEQLNNNIKTKILSKLYIALSCAAEFKTSVGGPFCYIDTEEGVLHDF